MCLLDILKTIQLKFIRRNRAYVRRMTEQIYRSRQLEKLAVCDNVSVKTEVTCVPVEESVGEETTAPEVIDSFFQHLGLVNCEELYKSRLKRRNDADKLGIKVKLKHFQHEDLVTFFKEASKM